MTSRSLAAHAARYPAVLFGLTGLLFAGAYLTAFVAFPRADARLVVGDAVHHFVQMRSVLYDGDLHFQNEYVRLYRLGESGERVEGDQWIFDDLTPTGHVRNYTPVGPALIWAPLYALFSAVLWTGALLGINPAPDGYEPLLQLAPGLTGIAAATGAAILAARLAARWAGREWATWGTAAVWLGSPAIYYSLVSPAYSHAPSMFAMALLLLVWVNGTAAGTPVRARWLLFSGMLSGVASLMRWQDAISLALPVYTALRQPATAAGRLRGVALVLAGWLLAFLPQMAVWQVLYGTPFTLPQGPGFMEWSRPNLLAVLFSANHGLLTWTPILLFAITGWFALIRRDPSTTVPLVCLAAAGWWINASVADWWAGEAFGARRFLSLFPLFAAGASVWLAAGRWRTWVAGALAAANLLLLLQYQLFMKGLIEIAPYPYEWFDLWLARFIVPFKLIGRWLA